MAGMKALGRVLDVVPNASGVGISLKNCSGIAFVAVTSSTTGATLAFTCATSYAGTYNNMTTASGFGQPGKWYSRSASTAAWTENTASWSTSTLTVAVTSGYASYVDFLVSELADTYDYIKVTGTNTVTGAGVTAILYDLTVQRKPANLAIVSA
jgi:hypothetical protein